MTKLRNDYETEIQKLQDTNTLLTEELTDLVDKYDEILETLGFNASSASQEDVMNEVRALVQLDRNTKGFMS